MLLKPEPTSSLIAKKGNLICIFFSVKTNESLTVYLLVVNDFETSNKKFARLFIVDKTGRQLDNHQQ